MTTDLHNIFELLDDWRHLPNYQLERRADIFFGLYLPAFLEERFGVAIDGVVPEFPVKRDLIWPEYETNKSVKVDYVAFAKDRSRCFFVELKTDGASRRLVQDHYLETCCELGMVAILEGLKSIVQASSAHGKYFHLLGRLEELGCVKLPEQLEEFVFPEARRGLRSVQEDIEVCVGADEFAVEVVYIQPVAPTGTSEVVISFEELAGWLDARGEMAEVFGEYLRRWIEPAGGAG